MGANGAPKETALYFARLFVSLISFCCLKILLLSVKYQSKLCISLAYSYLCPLKSKLIWIN